MSEKSLDDIMSITIQRIKKGIYFDSKLKPYQRDFLEKCLEYFQNKEDYQECIIIRDLINIRFNHERNYRNIKF